MIVFSTVVSKLAENRLIDEGYNGLVRCDTCGHTERVVMSHCMRTKWPEHCGQTMQLIRDEEAQS